MSEIKEKKCSKCEVVKPVSEFNIHKTSASGYDYKCRSCKAEYYKKYYQANTDTIAVRGVKYRKENRDTISKTQNKWRQANPGYHIAYRQKNEKRRSEYNSAYREEHKDEINTKNLTSYHKNRQQNLKKQAQWRKDNKAATRISSAKWRSNNPDRVYANMSKRRAAKLQRTVAWADYDAIKMVYSDCIEINLAARTAGCTERYVVDHKIPLQGELVSGLHVHTNLDIILESENASKGNKFTPGPY